ncbi:hypothetical protein QBC37DRAFT_369690 [Rhypophila decipiens]|uniref:RING-type E3 ubiquitin transferase n=1 Tax=Rhypophila decipiens TaxID=261697 RepID=A0AAN6YJL0_9PEZI|nr:hypothetical protein QBC37DRAFT_369690 [Rhypophila decipiens]
MASRAFGIRTGRLDATQQEVVYCHVCNHEWPRNERESIQCPRCNSEATEIIEPGSDPRNVIDFPGPDLSFLGPDLASPPRRTGSDSDPDEFYAEDYAPDLNNHPPLPSAVRREQERSRYGNRPPTGADDIMLRFTDMLHQMGARHGPPEVPGRDSASETASSAPRTERTSDEPAFMQPRIHRTTIRSQPFGGGITITSSTYGTTTTGGPAGAPDFDRLLGTILGIPPPPSPGERPNRPPVGGFAALLHEILGATMNPASAVHGDAVYTQEALDRIVSTLMEAHPQSNAAPPATQTAIEQLEKKKLTDDMIGSEGKAECTICIDDMQRGDEVTVLPCTHWFHGECVTLWLKEHNTCPICRRAIETTGERRERHTTSEHPENNTNPFFGAGIRSQSAAGPSGTESSQARPGRASRQHSARMDFFNPFDENDDMEERPRSFFASSRGFGSYPDTTARTADSAPHSLRTEMPGGYPSYGRNPNDTIHEDDREWDSAFSRARRRERDSEHDRDQAASGRRLSTFSLFGDPNSTTSRRDNNGSQYRDGGRSSSDGQGNSSGSASGGTNNHNPFSWIRNHFPRNSGGGSSSSENRDRERRWRP